MAGGIANVFRVVSGAIAFSPRGIVDKSELRTEPLSEQPVFPPVVADQWELLNERIGPVNRKTRITTEADPRSLADFRVAIGRRRATWRFGKTRRGNLSQIFIVTHTVILCCAAAGAGSGGPNENSGPSRGANVSGEPASTSRPPISRTLDLPRCGFHTGEALTISDGIDRSSVST